MCLGFDDQVAFSLNVLLFVGLTLVLQQRNLFVPYPSHDQILFFFFFWVKKLGSITIFSQKAIVLWVSLYVFSHIFSYYESHLIYFILLFC